MNTLIGSTPEKPLRCSKLSAISKCTMRLYLMSAIHDTDEDGEGGNAAQTGSLTHVGVAEFHRLQQQSLDSRRKAAWDAIKASQGKFPLADEDEVRLFITPYMNDPRNINANCIAVEEELRFTLPPHEVDESGLPIYMKGTLDQLRLDNGIPRVYDLKTGKPSGLMMIHDYAIQMAAYTYGVREVDISTGYLVRDGKTVWLSDNRTKALWQNAQPGCIIRAHGYRTRSVASASPDGVFWQPPFLWDQVEDILETVRLQVALYRNGYFGYGPGSWCSYCEFGGLTGCTQAYKNHLQQLSRISR